MCLDTGYERTHEERTRKTGSHGESNQTLRSKGLRRLESRGVGSFAEEVNMGKAYKDG